MFEDNNGAIARAQDKPHYTRNTQTDMRAHYVRDLVESGEIEVAHTTTIEQRVDVLKKTLCGPAFIEGCEKLGVLQHRK